MASYNKVLLMGNITRDIELRSTPSGQSVAKIGLAVNRHWTDQSGEKREETTFVDCDAWGKTAEIMAKYLAKGRPVFIEGRLKLDQWDDKETGQKRSKMGVVIESFQFIDSRQGAGGGSGGEGGYVETPSRAPARAARPAAAAPSRPAQEDANPDDIPF
ncbi:MAG TPA: single-stranded DNA-binding protein [Phycisphaerales bacterium]|nr:single-stranded DNA-binding protein [Phycisphaerales bacterium]